ncbi:MAG: Holliday junction branch migration protein RuvA, partial [Oscillospiraceae bacterium]
NLLSNVSPSKFALSVVTNDSQYLSKNTPGLGPKGAGRIILELKDKFKGMELDDIPRDEIFTDASCGDSEAIRALVVLGYSPQEAKRALEGVTGNVEDMIKTGLRNLMKG